MLDLGNDRFLFKKGETIIEEGTCGHSAYIILHGEVEVYKKSRWGFDVLISRLGSEEMIGEMALFDSQNIRFASVIAFTDTVEVQHIPKDSFQSLMDQTPEDVRQVVQVLADRLRKADNKIVMLS